MIWCESQVDLFRLTTAVLSSRVPIKGIPTCLFGNTPSVEGSLIEGGAAFHEAGGAKPIVLHDHGPYIPPNSPPEAPPAYSGGDLWHDELVLRGVPKENIVFIDSPRPQLSHTGTDAERFVRFAKSRGWKVVAVMACPPHLLRAFVITVRCLQREYPELLVYSQPGAPLPWDQQSSLAQAVVCKTLLQDGINLEWDRLNRVYGNPYDPVTAKEAIAYIEQRDERMRQLL